MPRLARYNPNKYPRDEQVARSKTYRVTGYKRWIDPYPEVHGTRPEKIVYEQLVRRGIKFYFLNDFTYSIPEIDFIKEYQTDFVLPDQKIVIEVQGAYWHSKPESIESDAFKLAVYQSAGWHVIAWWDFDIEEDINKLFRNEPLLSGYSYINNNLNTELAPVSRKKQDTSQGIRTLNAKRALRVSYRKKAVSIKKRRAKGLYTYATRIK